MEPVERRDEWVGCGEGDGVGSSAEGGEGEGVGLSAGSWGVEWIEFSAEGWEEEGVGVLIEDVVVEEVAAIF